MPTMRTLTVLVTAVLTALLTGLVLAPAPAVAATPGAPARIVRWVDGDTVVTSRGTVRLIGIDTPERGACGYAAATRNAARLAPVGSTVRLVDPRSVRDRDRYGRLLRFVDRGTRDIGASQVVAGARARYDSRDGYQWHPRQTRYHRLDRAHANYRCSAGTSTSGAVAPVGRSCPSYAPIKGNADSMIYHRPGQQYYDVTVPEACFRTAAAAEAAGFRAAKI